METKEVTNNYDSWLNTALMDIVLLLLTWSSLPHVRLDPVSYLIWSKKKIKRKKIVILLNINSNGSWSSHMFWNLTEHSLFEMSYATFLWIRNFFFADSSSVHTYPVNPAYESAPFWTRSPEWKFLNTLWIRNRVDAKSGYVFLSGDVTKSSPVL